VYTVAIYYKIFCDFFPNIWVGRRSKSHDVWCWLFGKWRFALPVSFEFVTNRPKNNTELNHTQNNVKSWSRYVIEINLHFLWLGLLFIKTNCYLSTQKIMSYWGLFSDSCSFLVSVIMSKTCVSLPLAFCLVANWWRIMMAVVEINTLRTGDADLRF